MRSVVICGLWLALLSWLGCGDRTDGSVRAGSAATAEGDPTPPVSKVFVSAIPDENPTALHRRYQPLVAYLEASLGTDVVYVPVTDYGAAVSAMAAGKVDFAWLGAFTHVQARHQGDVVPLCMRAVDREFKSVIVASPDITEVSQLKGKTFAFGAKSSTSGHLMPRHHLGAQFGLDPERDFARPPVFTGSHDATVKLVESGRIRGGAVNMLVWQRMVKEGQVDTTKVREVWRTPPFVDYVWTARKAVPAAIREKFRDAFLRLDARVADDRKLLALQDAEKFVVAQTTDFDVVERVAVKTGLLEPSPP
ncbi:MAG: putative selenate ABC transporter substrate-binding protein [Myxococcota bacterium]